MVLDQIEKFEAKIDEPIAADPLPDGCFRRAYVSRAFDRPEFCWKKTKFTTSIVFQDDRIPNLIYTGCTIHLIGNVYDVHTRILFIVSLLLRHTSAGLSGLSTD